jgi:hypothetical protein
LSIIAGSVSGAKPQFSIDEVDGVLCQDDDKDYISSMN